MSSSFDGWSAHDIVGPLNRSEVRGALLDHGIQRNCFRTWNTIERMVLESSDEIKNILYQCGLTKARVEEQHRLVVAKRRREDLLIARNVRRRIGMWNIFIFLKKFILPFPLLRT